MDDILREKFFIYGKLPVGGPGLGLVMVNHAPICGYVVHGSRKLSNKLGNYVGIK